MKNFDLQWKSLSSSPPSFNQTLLKFTFLFLALLFGLCAQSFAQQRTVSGRITSQNTGVAGATVQVKGTTTATQTDNNGSFTISAPANGTLIISSVGFLQTRK